MTEKMTPEKATKKADGEAAVLDAIAAMARWRCRSRTPSIFT
jgi:hypothetical protein